MNLGSQTPTRHPPHTGDLYSSPLAQSQQGNPGSLPNTLASSGNLYYEGNWDISHHNRHGASQEGSISPELTTPSTIYTCYDIYGNELKAQNNITPFEDDECSDSENLGEEQFLESEQVNKENTDPILCTVTPLKKRNERSYNEVAQGAQGLVRSPLVDITPPCTRKNNTQTSRNRIQRVLMYTPQQGTGNKSGQSSVIKTLR